MPPLNHTGNIPHSLTSAEKKRARDRRAQQNLRDKRNKLVKALKEKVEYCEASHSSDYIRELEKVCRALKQENRILRIREVRIRAIFASWRPPPEISLPQRDKRKVDPYASTEPVDEIRGAAQLANWGPGDCGPVDHPQEPFTPELSSDGGAFDNDKAHHDETGALHVSSDLRHRHHDPYGLTLMRNALAGPEADNTLWGFAVGLSETSETDHHHQLNDHNHFP